MISLGNTPREVQHAITLSTVNRIEDELRQSEQMALYDIHTNMPRKPITIGTVVMCEGRYAGLSPDERRRILHESQDLIEPIPYNALAHMVIFARTNLLSGEVQSQLTPEVMDSLVKDTRDILYGRSRFHTFG